MNLEKPNDPHRLTKRKNLTQLRENLARTSFQNWLLAARRAKKLRREGFNILVPHPKVGRPQLILISRIKPGTDN